MSNPDKETVALLVWFCNKVWKGLLSLVLKDISKIASHLGNTFRVKSREIPVKYPWNPRKMPEILCLTAKFGVWSDIQLYQAVFASELLWKSKKDVQCLHSFKLQWYQVGETSHLLVEHRISRKLNFDVGRAGIYCIITKAGSAQLEFPLL